MHLGKHTNARMHTRTHARAHTQEESEIQILPGFGMEFLGSIRNSPPSMGPSGLPQPEVYFPLLHLHSVLFLTFSGAQPILSSRYGLSMQIFSACKQHAFRDCMGDISMSSPQWPHGLQNRQGLINAF